MTHTLANGVERAIALCTSLCRHSSQPYLELGKFVWALRVGGVGESIIGLISEAVLMDLAKAMNAAGVSREAYAGSATIISRSNSRVGEHNILAV